MSIRNLNLGVNGVMVSYLIHYDSYYKMRRLLQIVTVNTIIIMIKVTR